MKIAVSFLASDNYKKCIEKINKTKADFIHVDLCDGKYTENKNFILSDMIRVLKSANKPLDIHMMVSNPLKYVDDLAYLNVDTITVHVDACKDIKNVIEYISNIGLKVGLAINPDQDVDIIKEFIPFIDRVLIMSVYPGLGGQSFIPEVLEKVDKLNELKTINNFEIAIDGGVNNESINLIKEKDIDLIISGSYITNSDDYDETIDTLL